MDKLLNLFKSLQIDQGIIEGSREKKTYLSDLQSYFYDSSSVQNRLDENPLIYRVSSVTPAHGVGQMHYGLGQIMPGTIGSEFFMTRGHFHQDKQAAEIYITYTGKGILLLQNLQGECEIIKMEPNTIAYVPASTAHRTVNISNEPLTYLGIYPANAGHDYTTIEKDNFRNLILKQKNSYQIVNRSSLSKRYQSHGNPHIETPR